MMDHIKAIKEELNLLRSRGFTDRQISQLCRLRKTYGQDQMDQPALDIRRLEFARYLVTTGRLGESEKMQLAANEEKSACG